MSVRDGYQMTELGQIPVSWEIKALSETCTKITDGSHYSPPEAKSGKYMASVKDMTNRGFEYSKCKMISEKDHILLVSQGCKPQKGDVLIAKDGATLLKQVFVQQNEEDITILSSIAILRSNQNIMNPFFLKHYFSWDQIKDKIRREYTSGSALPRIILTNFRRILIPLPPLPEQKKIADILSTVDEHISETESLIEKTKVLKRGMMQHLLTKGIGHTEFKDTEIGRIPVEWEVVRISNILKRVDARAVPLQTKDYSAEGKYPIVDQGQTYICGFTNNEDCLYRGELPVTIFGDHTRIVKYVDFAFAVGADGTQILIPQKDTFFNKYFYYAVLNIKIKNEGYQRHFKYLKESKIAIPIIQEQKEIASILTSIDNQIDSYQTKLTSLTKLKSALMQQLLTGKKRVKV